MKNKREMRLFAALLIVMFCMAAFPLAVFTGGGPEYEEALPKKQTEEATGGYEPRPLTPKSDVSLADNTQDGASGSKQFITVVTESGNYFYTIANRMEDGEDTAHLLNQVDEADLPGLINEGVKPQESIVTPKPGPTPGPEPEPEPEKSDTGGILAVTSTLALDGGDIFYYLKVMKPKQSVKGNSNLDDFDFEDDEDEKAKFEDEQEDTE